MRGVSVLALAVVALGLSTAGSAGGWTATLRVSYWEDGSLHSAPDSVWTLRCNPVGGTLAKPARACRKLAVGGAKLFAPTPPDTACTEIYGGPQRARIVGTVGGKRVWTIVTRTNGCEIGRWQRLSPWLLPPGGVT
ncbi:MAG TPA: SSI family serine proteinase inhibitor [Gaiellaceae bacterium]|nr:SSI family serine proteinase inhibitor [Gaiellaceae bacterium]